MSQYSKNLGIYLDSYESEGSQDETGREKYIYAITQNLFIKLRKLLFTRLNVLFSNLSKLASSYSSQMNYNINTDENILINNSFNINNIFDNEEQMRILKFEILRSKLMTLTNIIKKHINYSISVFKWKLQYKIEMEKFFNQDDNYLFILPQPKLFKFRYIYAYRKLIYVLKSYRYRINVILRNTFLRWRDLINDYSTSMEINENWAKKGKSSTQLIYVLNRIFAKYQFINIIFRLSFGKWKLFSLGRDQSNVFHDHSNPDNYGTRDSYSVYLESIYDLTKIIKNILIKQNKKTFMTILSNSSILPLNQFNDKLKPELDSLRDLFIKNKEKLNIEEIHKNTIAQYEMINLEQSEYKRLYNILSGLLFIHNKNYINKTLFQRFYKWKQNKIELCRSYDEEIYVNSKQFFRDKFAQGIKLLDNLFKSIYLPGNLFPKRIFFERIIQKIKIRNTLIEYGKKYKLIPHIVKVDNFKESIFYMRKTFNQIFSMNKLFTLIVNKKYSFSYAHNSLHKKTASSTYEKVNWNVHDALLFSFYKWKKEIIDRSKDKIYFEYRITSGLTQISNQLKSIKSEFFEKFRLFWLVRIENEVKRNPIKKISNFLFHWVKKIITTDKELAFKRIITNYKIMKYSSKNVAIRIIYLYNKYYRINNSSRIKLKSFNKWKLETQNKSLTGSHILKSQLMKQLISIRKLIKRKYCRDLKQFFTTFKIATKPPNKMVFYKSRQVSKIDYHIIANQSRILCNFEREEQKLKNEFTKYKYIISNSGEILLKCFFKKQFKLCSRYLKIWRNSLIENVEDVKTYKFIDILNHTETIQNENEILIGVYRKKKRNYNKTIEDYEYLKSSFCDNCNGENFEIDYKSLNNEVNENEVEESVYKTQTSSMLDENFRLDSKEEDFQKPNSESLAKKIAEMEKNIKNHQIIFDKKIEQYETLIKSYEDTKKELISMKEKIIKAKKNNTKM